MSGFGCVSVSVCPPVALADRCCLSCTCAAAQVEIVWVNDLRDETGALRTTHYLDVDECLHGPNFAKSVPFVVPHLHGGKVRQESGESGERPKKRHGESLSVGVKCSHTRAHTRTHTHTLSLSCWRAPSSSLPFCFVS